jgi:4'-phosphopantetheinyl transferase
VAVDRAGSRFRRQIRARPRATARVDVACLERRGSEESPVASLLARRLRCDPADVRLARGRLGKPHLAGPITDPPLEFSVAHSGGRSLIAVCEGGAVGVDVEQRRPIGDLDRIAELYLAPVDVRAVVPARGDRKLTEFFGRWTAKEAYTKALGTGLSTPFESFGLPSPADDVTWFTAGGCDWTLWQFEPWPGYTASVVASGRRPRTALHLRVGDGVWPH